VSTGFKPVIGLQSTSEPLLAGYRIVPHPEGGSDRFLLHLEMKTPILPQFMTIALESIEDAELAAAAAAGSRDKEAPPGGGARGAGGSGGPGGFLSNVVSCPILPEDLISELDSLGSIDVYCDLQALLVSGALSGIYY
jgi:hypothetical protein